MAVIVIHDCALFKLFYLKKSRYDQNQKYNKYNEIILWKFSQFFNLKN